MSSVALSEASRASPCLIDISNTAKESRVAVAQAVAELPWCSPCARKLDPMAALVWVDRALPIKKFYLQRIASNRRQFQRANRFFGMDQVVDKCALTKAVEASLAVRRACYPHKEVHTTLQSGEAGSATGSDRLQSCLPRSWCLPRDENLLAELRCGTRPEVGADDTPAPEKTSVEGKARGLKDEDRWYIAKPDRGRCGRGIGLFSDPAKLVEEFRAGQLCVVEKPENSGSSSRTAAAKAEGSTSVVVQEYISRPLLFRDTGCKFDLRIYVIIKRLSPTLEALVFSEGLVRVATTPYTPPNASNCQIATMHLTNSHVNSRVVGHKKIDTAEGVGPGITAASVKYDDVDKKDAAQTKYTVTDTLDWISEMRGVPAADIWSDVCGSVSSAIAAIHPFAALKHATCYGAGDKNSEGRCFQLLGVDVILDNNLKPWVLEINNSPSLNLSTAVDERIKLPLIKSFLAEVFGREDRGAIDACASPRFEPLKIRGDAKIALDVQVSVLECYKQLCGHRIGSHRPLTSTKPARDMHTKLSKKVAAAAAMAAADSDGAMLLWGQEALPSRAECDLWRFTIWITSLAKCSRVSLGDAVAEVRSVLNEK